MRRACTTARLEDVAIKYLCANFGAVAGDASWLERNEADVRAWLGMDELVVSCEQEALDALLRWVAHDASSREAAFERMFGDASVVRLSQLTVAELEAVRSTPLAQQHMVTGS